MFSYVPEDELKTVDEALRLAGFPMSCPENGQRKVVCRKNRPYNVYVNLDGRFWSMVGGYCSLYSWIVAMQDRNGRYYVSNLSVAVVVDYWGSEGTDPSPYEKGTPKGLKTILFGGQ
jgi:hypothetical protein